MQVNFKQDKNISFAGQRLFKVKLKNPVDSSDVKACFTKMDDSDIALAHKLKKIWKDTRFGTEILDEYFRGQDKCAGELLDDVFMVECPELLGPKQRVKALAHIKEYPEELNLAYIQSASKIYGIEHVKGAGEMMIYGLVKLAKELNKKYISLISSSLDNDIWYYKLGFNQWHARNILPKEKFDLTLEYISKKYGLK